MQNVFNIFEFEKPLEKWHYALYRPCKMEDYKNVTETSKEDAEFYGVYIKRHDNLTMHVMDVLDEETANKIVFLINSLGEMYEDPNDQNHAK